MQRFASRRPNVPLNTAFTMRQFHSATRRKRMQNAAAIESPKGIAPLPSRTNEMRKKRTPGRNAIKIPTQRFRSQYPLIHLNTAFAMRRFHFIVGRFYFIVGRFYFAPRAERKRRESASRKGKSEKRKKQNGGVCGRRREIEDYHLKIVDKSAISLLSCGISRSHCATNNNNNR